MMRTLPAVAPALSLLLVLSGCATPRVIPPSQSGTAIQGAVSLGGQPVAGARIYLLAPSPQDSVGISLLTAATSGTDLLGAYLRSGPDGSFFIPAGSYACSPDTSIYLYAPGGEPASPSGRLALAHCSGPNPFIQLRDAAGLTLDVSGGLWITGFGTTPLLKLPGPSGLQP